MAQMLAVFTELERRLIGERTTAALAIKRGQGVRLGRPRTVSPEVLSNGQQQWPAVWTGRAFIDTNQKRQGRPSLGPKSLSAYDPRDALLGEACLDPPRGATCLFSNRGSVDRPSASRVGPTQRGARLKASATRADNFARSARQ